MAGTGVMKSMWLALANAGSTVFRNNVALAAVGKITWIRERVTVTLNAGDAVVRNARVLHAGLAKGSGDLIGLTPVVVTQEMVGSTIAVFTSIESKDGSGASTKEQKAWRAFVLANGGYAGEARDDKSALAIVGK